MKKILLSLVSLALTGCVSGYSQFYKPIEGATPEVISSIRSAPPSTNPKVHHISTVPDFEHYMRLGYVQIGYSSFNSGRNETEQGAISQAIKVGADLVVIVNPQYTGSVTSQMPLTTPTTTTSYSSGSATAYGSGGTATVYGNATTTTYGSQTTYVPVTVNRYDYGAVYFIKRKFSFGAVFRDLNNEERNSLQTNSGVYITIVVNETPAFYSDILVGDIIVKIDGNPIHGSQAASDIFGTKQGQEIVLSIYRNGQILEKKVKLDT
ncbi:MAG: PDZ domain-containing protein [Gammaproteobacteria bacterium]